MDVLLVVAPVFALIAIGLVASLTGLLSEGGHKGISEFAFGIAIPALLFRTIATTEFPALSPVRVWGAYFGAVAITWVAASIATAVILRRPAGDGVIVSIGAVYGNIVLLGIPLALAAFGPAAAGPMALILGINTPVIWLVGALQIGWADRKPGRPIGALLLDLASDLARNPILLGILGGFLLRLSGLGLHPVADKVLSLVAQAGVPASLVALGAGLRHFRILGQLPTLTVMCALKLIGMPLAAWWLAFELIGLPPVAAAVVVLFAAMPTGVNVYIFASRYQRVVNSASGAIALGTLLSVLSCSVLLGVLLRSIK